MQARALGAAGRVCLCCSFAGFFGVAPWLEHHAAEGAALYSGGHCLFQVASDVLIKQRGSGAGAAAVAAAACFDGVLPCWA